MIRLYRARFSTNYPDPPLFPSDRARRAEVETFMDWFNRVWKRFPNEIEAELRRDQPDRERISELSAEMSSVLDRFEAMLTGSDFLMGEFSAADCVGRLPV